MLKYYAGIGSRKTPPNVLSLMTKVASLLQKEGYILRSGGADGADTAFEDGIINIDDKLPMQIFLPWKGFNNRISPEYISDYNASKLRIAMDIASKNHPYWANLRDPVSKLMVRNVFQVLGPNLMPDSYSSFVLCWTPDGAETDEERTMETGGTGLAISIASKYDIPVLNLGRKEHLELLDNPKEIVDGLLLAMKFKGFSNATSISSSL